MIVTVIRTKSYRVALAVGPSKAREDRGEGNLRELTALVVDAPVGSKLRRCKMAPEHREGFPMLHVERSGSALHRWYTLQFWIEAEEDTDAVVAELYAVFAKNEWERA